MTKAILEITDSPAYLGNLVFKRCQGQNAMVVGLRHAITRTVRVEIFLFLLDDHLAYIWGSHLHPAEEGWADIKTHLAEITFFCIWTVAFSQNALVPIFIRLR